MPIAFCFAYYLSKTVQNYIKYITMQNKVLKKCVISVFCKVDVTK